MSFLIILSPFIAVACLLAFTSASISLFAGCAVALALVGFDLWRGREVKMLPAGSVFLFAALGGYQGLIEHEWNDFSIRLAINVGMLTIALVSIAMKMPFTLQYAREQVDAETTREPAFLRVNYVLSWAWVGAMLLMLVADIFMIYFPSLPLWTGLVAIYAARNAAIYFTKWYSSRWIEKGRAVGLKT
jgi:hypothetical protein